jgi:phosphinothricin acetyltransferase
MNFAIRPVDPDADLPAVTAIYAEAVCNGTGSFELEAVSEGDMANRMMALVNNGYPYLVAVAEDEGEEMVIGFAYAGVHKPRPAYRFTVESSIYLSPFARGKGVGTHLLNALIVASEKRGFRQMVAVIGDSNNFGSILVHGKCGFEEIGRFEKVGYKFNKWLDVVFMQRSLGDGSATPPG